MRRRRAVLFGGLAAAVVVNALMALDRLAPPPVEKALDVSRVVLDRNNAPLRAIPLADGRWRLRADLDRLDPAFTKALLAYEDKRFLTHSGVDAVAIGRAALSFLKAGRVVSGGSTITMQTARLLEPRPRNLSAKLVQAFRAWQLERRYSKTEILEIYLTLAPYGGNLEGVRAASWAYFGMEPQDLTPDQIALLVALPQSPEARRPDLRPEAAKRARARVLDRLAERGVFAPDVAEESKTAAIPVRGAFPGLAWQASDTLLSALDPGVADARTTLDIRLQRAMEGLAARSARGTDSDTQFAILVVDVHRRAVRASVGAAARDRPGGWLDLTNRPRSPGSALKPFIYGLAFDDGVAAPGTRIADLPRRFQTYAPENFDRTFRGDVTMAEALQHSLNVPAVHTLDAVGPSRFAAALTFAYASPVLPSGPNADAGLALALGGAGFTMRDIAVLYAALGEGGMAAPLRWLEDAPMGEERRLMSAESADEILQILRQAPAPEGRMPSGLTAAAPRIAFKTGTSYGFRDAWAAGTAGGYAIVVWAGRADGAPRPAATGRDVSLPVLFDAFDLVAQILPGAAGRDAAGPDVDRRRKETEPLARFDPGHARPEILFPPDKAEIWSDAPGRGFVLAARGQGDLDWYVEGAPVPRDAGGEPVWTPPGPGFYALSVVDDSGRSAVSRVRIMTAGR